MMKTVKERTTSVKRKMRTASVLLALVILVSTLNSVGIINAIASEDEEKTVDGVLVCGNCYEAPPAIHPVDCTLMDGCKASGYGIIVPQSDKTYRFYKFDEEGDTYAYNTLLELKEQGVANYLTVKVTGIITDEEGTYGYTFTNKSGEEDTDEYDYDGTITNISLIEYDGSHENFETYAKPINDKNVKVEPIDKQEYTGEEINPDIIITDGDYTLKFRNDYLLEYADNIEEGTATVTVKGIGAFYSGEVKQTFEIVAKESEAEAEYQETSSEAATNPENDVIADTVNSAEKEPVPQTGDGDNSWILAMLISSFITVVYLRYRQYRKE